MKHANRNDPLHTWGVFFSLSGIGGLLTLWAADSVYAFPNDTPWAWTLMALLGMGLFLYIHTHPTRQNEKARGFPNQ